VSDCAKKLEPQIHIGDVDTSFVFEVKDLTGIDCDDPTICDPPALDLTGATAEMFFKKPDDSVVTVTATVLSPATDGKIEYRTVSGFLDQAGTWRRQGRVSIPPGSWSTGEICFEVFKNLDT